MQRPTNKEELLFQSEKKFSTLLNFIDTFSEEEKNKIYSENELNNRDKTFADIICHLHEWHVMRKAWYEEGIAGKKPSLRYSLQTLPIINQSIWEKYKGTEFTKAISLFTQSHKDITVLILKHSDEELFTKGKYFFTGSTTLGAYFFYNTADHYSWGIKTIGKTNPNEGSRFARGSVSYE